ncbi:hypothetical protein ABZ942_15700 [Nocardia sp. NPDC046473]|uniref:hypothetical protein n=1 Tax=Nocardia sp. NPDC046473 TaxID=3155733 RepID=UPI0033C2E179
MNKPSRQLLTQLRDEHLQAPFPPPARGVDIAGVDLVMVDAGVAGCVHTALSRALDDDGRRSLVRCIGWLDTILPNLEDDYEVEYFGRVRDLAMALAAYEEIEIDTGLPLTSARHAACADAWSIGRSFRTDF